MEYLWYVILYKVFSFASLPIDAMVPKSFLTLLLPQHILSFDKAMFISPPAVGNFTSFLFPLGTWLFLHYLPIIALFFVAHVNR